MTSRKIALLSTCRVLRDVSNKYVTQAMIEIPRMFFATMIRLRLGLLEQDLAERFQVAISTMLNILITWITYLHRVLVEFNWWPSREKVQALMPPEFDEFKRTRVVLDATEIFIEKPSDLQNQTVTWSNYKSHNTLKGLVGIAPFGGVTFVSPLYTGSISDKELTLESGLLDLVEGSYAVIFCWRSAHCTIKPRRIKQVKVNN